MKNLIEGAKLVFAWWPVKVVVEELESIPTKLEWRWLEKVQKIEYVGLPSLKSYYSTDFVEL